jgi:hypothetical protein
MLPRGAFKPPAGAYINADHQFAQKLLFCIPFLGQSYGDFNTTSYPIIFGSTPRQDIQVGTPAGFAYSSNREGVCAAFTNTSTNLLLLGANPIPAARVTICLIRRKHDTTARTGTVYCVETFAQFERCQVHLPFSDGNVYWDFGGFSGGTTRLSVGGLSFSTTIPDRFVLTAGPSGMKIFQNGVKVASHATANPGRTVGTNRFGLGAGGGNGDLHDYNYFAAYDDEWSDEMCRWWSMEPYAHLYRPLSRFMADFDSGGGGGGASTFPALSVAI